MSVASRPRRGFLRRLERAVLGALMTLALVLVERRVSRGRKR